MGKDRNRETNLASMYVHLQVHFTSFLSTHVLSFRAALRQSSNDLGEENQQSINYTDNEMA